MKTEEILAWFKTDRTFDAGVSLFVRYSFNLSARAIYTKIGYTTENYRNLCYDLAKIAEIPEQQYKAILATPLSDVVAEPPNSPSIENSIDYDLDDLILNFVDLDLATVPYKQQLALAKALNVEVLSKKKSVVLSSLQELQQKKN